MYNYETTKPELFTDDGQRMFLHIRDNVKKLLEMAGAVRADKAWANAPISGSSWLMLACLDRMVELGELKKITREGTAGQHEVYIQA